jgi:hypothetical protein
MGDGGAFDQDFGTQCCITPMIANPRFSTVHFPRSASTCQGEQWSLSMLTELHCNGAAECALALTPDQSSSSVPDAQFQEQNLDLR